MPLTTNNARPPFQQLADLLRDEITSGARQPGTPLPTIQELADTHGIATATVKNALRVLREEGLIASQQGRGSWVRTDLRIGAEDAQGEEEINVGAVVAEIRKTLASLEARVSALEARQKP